MAIMNPLVVSFIGNIVRFFAATAFGWFVQRGVFTENQAEIYVSALAIGAPTLIWGLWEKYKSKLLLNTAVALPAAVSVEEVKAIVAEKPAAENVVMAFKPKDQV